jgi:four helix bundle protein
MASQTKPEYHGYKGKNTQTYKKLYGYKNLLVWQAADDLTAQIHTLTRRFGAGYYAHASQMLGSASSAKANIAEGYCRNALGDYIRFCEIARGSLGELGSQIQDCERWGLIKNDELTDILKTFSNTTYFLEQLIKSLHENRKEGTWDRTLGVGEEKEAYQTDTLSLEFELPEDFPPL